MKRLLIAIGSLVFYLALAFPAQAQQETPLEVAVLRCVGPGIPDPDAAWNQDAAILRTLPTRDCQKVCKLQKKGCVNVEKAIDKCGVAYLKSTYTTGKAACIGLGGNRQQCNALRNDLKRDTAIWLALSDVPVCTANNNRCLRECR